MTSAIPKSLRRGFRDGGAGVLDFAEKNGWVASMTRGNHVKLFHPVAGIYFSSLTSGDWKGGLKAKKDMARMMRGKGVGVK